MEDELGDALDHGMGEGQLAGAGEGARGGGDGEGQQRERGAELGLHVDAPARGVGLGQAGVVAGGDRAPRAERAGLAIEGEGVDGGAGAGVDERRRGGRRRRAGPQPTEPGAGERDGRCATAMAAAQRALPGPRCEGRRRRGSSGRGREPASSLTA